MKYFLTLVLSIFLYNITFGQVPNEITGINYQGIAREADGTPVVETDIEITITLLNNSNSAIYIENHPVISTNQFGLFTLIIGNGTVSSSSTYTSLNTNVWNEATEIKTEADFGNGPIDIGTVDLAAIPYAFKAKYEGQEIDLTSSGYLRISDGTKLTNGQPNYIDSVNVGSGGTGADNWGSDVVNTSGSNITGDGTSGSPLIVTDGDTDATNEIELPATATTNQVLTWNGTSWVAQNSSSGADNWGAQTVVGGTGFSGNGTSSSPLNFTESDGSVTNEIQDLTITGNILTITNNSSPTSIDLSTYLELPATASTNQVLTWNGTSWVAQNSSSGADNWGAQTVVGGTGFSGNGTSSSPLNFTESDGSVTNEIQDLTITGNILTITNNGSPTSIDLSTYLELPATASTNQVLTWNGTSWVAQNSLSSNDKDWQEVGTTSAPNSISDTIFTLGNVGVGLTNPASNIKLHIKKNDLDNNSSAIYVDASTSTTSGVNAGIKLNSSISGASEHRGIESSVTKSTSGGQIFASYNGANGDNSSSKIGVYARANGSDGSKTGLSAYTSGNNGDQTGVLSQVGLNAASGTNYGFRFNNLNTASVTTFGIHTTGEDFNYFSGNVGIGTNAPSYNLDILTSTTSTNPIMAIRNSGTTGDVGLLFESNNNTSGNNYIIGYDASDQAFKITQSGQSLNSGSGARLVISDDDGHIGIGTTSPSAKLVVNSGVTTTDPLSVDVLNTPLFIVKGDGNVGIGTSSPSQKLEVSNGGIMVSSTSGTNNNLLISQELGNSVLKTGNLFEIQANGGGSTNFSIDDGDAVFNVTTTIKQNLIIDNSSNDVELQRNSTGNANLVPVAYGFISVSGTVVSGASTSNVVSSSFSGSYVEIEFSGDLASSFNGTSYNVFISPKGITPIAFSNYASGNKLRVRFTGNALTPFDFIIYKK